ncbi:MAG: hypothetical protein F6K00_22905 [Leptolyngbya sp. SIOISBB]|nr:hypothetical protein [Leptolyngbya sp. SIOISBB]
MHPISLIFLGLCAFLVGFWLVRKLERRKIKSSGPQATIPPTQSVPANSAYPDETNRESPPVSLAHLAETQWESPPIEPAQPANAHREPSPAKNGDIRDLILENRQSAAINLLHEQHDWDLEHAKEYVAQQEQRQSSKQLDPEVIAAAQKLLAENRKIVAIKLIYDHTGWSLKAAKDYVENSLSG